MFHFSFEQDAPLTADEDQQATANVTEVRDWAERLKQSGEYSADERYFRAENEDPDTVEEAVDFVRGIFGHVPRRVWMDDEVHELH